MDLDESIKPVQNLPRALSKRQRTYKLLVSAAFERHPQSTSANKTVWLSPARTEPEVLRAEPNTDSEER